MCHKTEKQGKQFAIWSKAKHSKAYQTLKSDKANDIAKKQGFKTPAVESKECLECHTLGRTVDAKLLNKSFDMTNGVQCETCHGAGSAYKSMSVMKDHGKAVAAGMTDFKDEKAIEAFCRTCHNKKSPTFKGFNYKEMRAKIIHSIPKAG
jgi:DnaJ-class molecular chaperone